MFKYLFVFTLVLFGLNSNLLAQEDLFISPIDGREMTTTPDGKIRIQLTLNEAYVDKPIQLYVQWFDLEEGLEWKSNIFQRIERAPSRLAIQTDKVAFHTDHLVLIGGILGEGQAAQDFITDEIEYQTLRAYVVKELDFSVKASGHNWHKFMFATPKRTQPARYELFTKDSIGGLGFIYEEGLLEVGQDTLVMDGFPPATKNGFAIKIVEMKSGQVYRSKNLAVAQTLADTYVAKSVPKPRLQNMPEKGSVAIKADQRPNINNTYTSQMYVDLRIKFATGFQSLNWYRDGKVVSGETSYRILSLNPKNAGAYWVEAQRADGSTMRSNTINVQIGKGGGRNSIPNKLPTPIVCLGDIKMSNYTIGEKKLVKFPFWDRQDPTDLSFWQRGPFKKNSLGRLYEVKEHGHHSRRNYLGHNGKPYDQRDAYDINMIGNAEEGLNVYPVYDGVVIMAQTKNSRKTVIQSQYWSEEFGQWMVFIHDYLHTRGVDEAGNFISIKRGMDVRAADPIGVVSNQGCHDIHLHHSVMVEHPADPEQPSKLGYFVARDVNYYPKTSLSSSAMVR